MDDVVMVNGVLRPAALSNRPNQEADEIAGDFTGGTAALELPSGDADSYEVALRRARRHCVHEHADHRYKTARDGLYEDQPTYVCVTCGSEFSGFAAWYLEREAAKARKKENRL